MRPALLAAASLALCVTLAARAGDAYERQQHVGLTLGGALAGTNGADTKTGIDFGLRYTYGWSDAFNIVVDVGDMALGTEPRPAKNVPPQPGNIAVGGVGLAYVFDVTRWVPYAGVTIGAAHLGGGLMPQGLWTPDAQLIVGLDYQLSRAWSIGGSYAQHMLFTQTGTYPELSTLGARVEYVWGW